MFILQSGSVDPSSERFKLGNGLFKISLQPDCDDAIASPLELDSSEPYTAINNLTIFSTRTILSPT
jgi:hypothetical protein